MRELFFSTARLFGFRAVLVGLAVFAAVRPCAVWASPIRKADPDPPHVSGHALQELKQFLARGPKYWAKHQPPKLPSGLRLMTSTGHLKHNALVEFLIW